MVKNIIDKYIEITRKQIIQYMKLVFKSEFKLNICENYIEKYINVRYYNFYENDINTKIRTRILEQLKKEQDRLIIDNISDREFIEKCCIFFYYVLYFDKVIQSGDIRKTIRKNCKVKNKNIRKRREGI